VSQSPIEEFLGALDRLELDAIMALMRPPSPDAVARAAAQVPNRRLTTLAAGHSPPASRSSASPLRARACAREQS